jgi:hypothetical protein
MAAYIIFIVNNVLIIWDCWVVTEELKTTPVLSEKLNWVLFLFGLSSHPEAVGISKGQMKQVATIQGNLSAEATLFFQISFPEQKRVVHGMVTRIWNERTRTMIHCQPTFNQPE